MCFDVWNYVCQRVREKRCRQADRVDRLTWSAGFFVKENSFLYMYEYVQIVLDPKSMFKNVMYFYDV